LLLGFKDVPIQGILLNILALVDFVLFVLAAALGRGESLFNDLIKVSFEGILHAVEFAFHRTVPVVLDRVVGSTVKIFGDVGPAVFELSVLEEENPLLFVTPIYFLNAGVQMVVPALTTLLALAAG